MSKKALSVRSHAFLQYKPNKSSAVAKMAAQRCTSRIVKIWRSESFSERNSERSCH